MTALWRDVVARLGTPGADAPAATRSTPCRDGWLRVAERKQPPRFVQDALRVLGGNVAMTLSAW